MTGTRFIGALAAALVLTGPVHAQPPDAEALYRQIIDLSAAGDFQTPTGPVTLDPVAHPNTQSETWLVVAHLRSPNGETATVQANFSRLGLRAPSASEFDVTALYRGHLILLAEDGSTQAEERISRGLGAAGADTETVWIDDWSLDLTKPGALNLTLAQTGSLTLDIGASVHPQKADDPDLPFIGYSLPDVPVSASLDGRTMAGTAWIDHFWGAVPLPGGPLAYDRLILHLEDGSALSLLRARRRDGQGIATLDGALIDASGQSVPLSDATVEFSDTRLSGAGLDLKLEGAATADAAFAFPVITTLLTAAGTLNGSPVSGIGSLQLSGARE